MKYIVVWDYGFSLKTIGLRIYNLEVGWTVARPNTELFNSSQYLFDKTDLQSLYHFLSIQVDGKRGVEIAKKHTIPLDKVSKPLRKLLK